MKTIKKYSPFSFVSICIQATFLLLLFVAYSLLFLTMDHMVWLALSLCLMVMGLIMIFAFLKPIKNILSKSYTFYDSFNSSLCISSFFFSFISCPFINIYKHEKASHISSLFFSILFLLCFLVLIFRCLYIKKNNKLALIHKTYHLQDFLSAETMPDKESEAFILDEAVNIDLFDFGDLVDQIYKSIVAYKGDENIIIGVTGKWGSGKTTCVNNVVDRLDEKKYIICNNFDIWQYDNMRAMVVALIEHIYLSLDIGKKNKLIDSMIEKYASNFFAGGSGDIINAVLSLQNDDDNIAEIINSYLIQNDKRIVLTIDNFDRAVSKEILNTYRIIASTINVKRITYLCLYDEEVVSELLKAEKVPSNYLDKIINIKHRIEPPAFNLIYNTAITCIDNYFKKYKNKEFIAGLSKNDKAILEELLSDVKNPRSLIILLNQLFSYFNAYDNGLNIIDLMSVIYLESAAPDLIKTIRYNPKFFVTVDKEYIPGNYDFFISKEQKKKEKSDFVEKYFNNEKSTFYVYKNLVSLLFPHFLNLDDYSRVDDDVARRGSVDQRIYSGKYFNCYFSRAKSAFASLYFTIKDLLKKQYKESFDESLTTLFKTFDENDYVEILKVIEECLSEANETTIIFLLNYLEEHYFSFNDLEGFFSLSARNRCAIIIADILSTISTEKACSNIKKFKNNFNYITMLSNVLHWVDSNERRKNIGGQIKLFLSTLLKDTCNRLVNRQVNVYNSRHFKRGITWRLRENVDVDGFNGYILHTVNRKNVLAYISEFISMGITTDKDKPYVLSLEKNRFKDTPINLNELRAMVSSMVPNTNNLKIIKKLFMQLFEEKDLSSTHESEMRFEEPPLFIDNLFE